MWMTWGTEREVNKTLSKNDCTTYRGACESWTVLSCPDLTWRPHHTPHLSASLPPRPSFLLTPHHPSCLYFIPSYHFLSQSFAVTLTALPTVRARRRSDVRPDPAPRAPYKLPYLLGISQQLYQAAARAYRAHSHIYTLSQPS